MKGRVVAARLARMARSALHAARPLILMYHRIGSPRADPWGLAVSTENFAAQIEVIKRHRSPVPMSWLAKRLASGKSARGAVALTFDDAYADVLLNGVPVMERAGVPATLFVPPAFVGRTDGFWWDTLTRLFFELDRLPDTLEFAGQRWDLGDTPPSSRREDAFRAIWGHLKAAGAADRSVAMVRLREWAGLPASAPAQDRCMTASQLSQFHRPDLFDLGGHTMTHVSLPLLSEERQREEIEGSLDWLRDRFEVKDPGFAYPYGDNDEVTRTVLASSGTPYACTTHPSAARRPHVHLGLPRVQVNNLHAEGFEQLLAEHA